MVLDLSQVPDDVDFYTEVDPEIKVLAADVQQKGDDIVLTLDLDVPEEQLEEGVDIEVEISGDGEIYHCHSIEKEYYRTAVGL